MLINAGKRSAEVTTSRLVPEHGVGPSIKDTFLKPSKFQEEESSRIGCVGVGGGWSQFILSGECDVTDLTLPRLLLFDLTENFLREQRIFQQNRIKSLFTRKYC